MPEYARGVHTIGSVLLYEATLGESGEVRDVRLVRPLPEGPGYADIDRAFREQVSTWRYSQTMIDGEPVPVCFIVSLTIDVR